MAGAYPAYEQVAAQEHYQREAEQQHHQQQRHAQMIHQSQPHHLHAEAPHLKGAAPGAAGYSQHAAASGASSAQSSSRATINDFLASTGYSFSNEQQISQQHQYHQQHAYPQQQQGPLVVAPGAGQHAAATPAVQQQLAQPGQGHVAPPAVVQHARAQNGNGASTPARRGSVEPGGSTLAGSRRGSEQKGGASLPLPQTAADLLKEGPRDFRIIRDVGDGSFGTVFLADWRSPLPSGTDVSLMQHPSTRPEFQNSRLVAIKKMKKQYRNWAECLTLKELKSLLAIPAHPHIIPLYDAFLLPSTHELHFVFECMEGNLYQLTKSRKGRPLAQGLIATIFRQIVEGLHHIHSHGYFHRDLKPENLLLTTLGLSEYPCPGRTDIIERDVLVIVKIADFGLARETSSIPPFTEYVSTRWYRAPEVLLRARDYSNPVDIWAVGTIMAEIINLRPLFPGSSEVTQVMAICEIMGTPSADWPLDDRGKRMGGGPWPRGFKMAAAVGFQWPQCKPIRLAKLFGSRTPMSLIDCISELLQYEPNSRLTTAGLMEHPYFLRDANSLRPIASRSIIPKDKIQAAAALGHVVPAVAKVEDPTIRQSLRAGAEPPRELPPSHAYSQNEQKPRFGSTSPERAAARLQPMPGSMAEHEQAPLQRAPFYPQPQQPVRDSQAMDTAEDAAQARANLTNSGLPVPREGQQYGDARSQSSTVYDVDLRSGQDLHSPAHSQVGHAGAAGMARPGAHSTEEVGQPQQQQQQHLSTSSDAAAAASGGERRKLKGVGKWASRVFRDKHADEQRHPYQPPPQGQQQQGYPSSVSLAPSSQPESSAKGPYGRTQGYPSTTDASQHSDDGDNESLYEVLDENPAPRPGGIVETVARGRARGVVSKRHVQWKSGQPVDPSQLGQDFMAALVSGGSVPDGSGGPGAGLGGSQSRQSLAGSIATVGDLQHNPRAGDTAPFPYAEHHTFGPSELSGYERWEREQERRRRQGTASSSFTHRSNDSDPGPHRRQFPSRMQRGTSAASHTSQPGFMDRRIRGTTGSSTQSDAARSVHSLDQDLIADMRSMFPRDTGRQSRGNGAIRSGSASPSYHAAIASRFHPYGGPSGGITPSGRPPSNGPATAGAPVVSPQHSAYNLARGYGVVDYGRTPTEASTAARAPTMANLNALQGGAHSPVLDQYGHQGIHPSYQPPPPPQQQQPQMDHLGSYARFGVSNQIGHAQQQQQFGSAEYMRAQQQPQQQHRMQLQGVPTLPSFAEFAAGANASASVQRDRDHSMDPN